MPALLARAAVSSALLVPQDRVARAPVPRWAAELRTTMAELRRHERRIGRFAEVVGTTANNAALIATFQGAGQEAGELCEAQIRWQMRTARRTRDAAIAQLAVQPWVNLGRLEALRGEWERALERFARLIHPGADGRLCLGSSRIPASDDGSTGGFAGFLRNVYVVDSLKALLMARQFAEVLRFADRLPPDPRLLRRADEARIVALARIGDHQRALDVARAAIPESTGWTRVVFKLRQGEALAAAGDEAGAGAVLRSLAGVLRQVSPATRERLEILYILLRVGQACAEAGEAAAAEELARACRTAAEAGGDEVARIEALRLLCAMAPGESEGEPGETLRELERTTGYARYRSDGASELRDPEAERLYAELRDTFGG